MGEPRAMQRVSGVAVDPGRRGSGPLAPVRRSGMTLLLMLLLSIARGCDRPQQTGAQPPVVSGPRTPAPERAIRVLLQDNLNDCDVTLAESFDVVDPASGQTLLAAQPAGQVAVIFEGNQIRFPLIDREYELAAIDLLPHGSQAVEVRMPTQWRRFRGCIRLLRRGPNTGAVLNVVDVEEYLCGVVSAELPAGFAPAAFRAQAIAARTYAWYTRQTFGQKRDYDIYATERSQVYLGLDRERLVPEALAAVQATTGLVCTWSGPQGEQIFCTYYSSQCGGTTVAVSSIRREATIPPLAGGVACEYCRRPEARRWDDQPIRLSLAEVLKRMAARYEPFQTLSRLSSVQVAEATPDGRATRVIFIGPDGRQIDLEAENFRLAVDSTGRVLRSTYMALAVEGEDLLVTGGKGYGHGMGMCQYGADAIDRAGSDAAAILAWYYPGSHLTRAY